jgi:hypothetical protein
MKTLIITLLFWFDHFFLFTSEDREGHEGRNYESARFTCCRN